MLTQNNLLLSGFFIVWLVAGRKADFNGDFLTFEQEGIEHYTLHNKAIAGEVIGAINRTL